MAFNMIVMMVFSAFIIGIIAGWSSLPVVQFSWSTGECVSVSNGDCNTLPEKYVHEWVK